MEKSSTPESGDQLTLTAVLENATEPLYLLRPSLEVLDTVVRIAKKQEDPPLIHVFATEEDLRTVRQTFFTATYAADLIRNDDLTLTPRTPSGRGTLIVSEEAVYSVATVDEHQFVIPSTNAPESLIERCSSYHRTQTFDLRTSGWTPIVESLEEAFSAEIRDDFSAAIETKSTSSDEMNLDEVAIALLVASKNELLLYNLSKWGEEIQLCSKATFSRTKSELEDHGIIETEKVPIEVGRPRLRLMLSDEYDSLSIPELLHELSPTISE